MPLIGDKLNSEIRSQASHAARTGLDFMVRHQIVDKLSGDCGRFPAEFLCTAGRICHLSGNWMTSIAIEALLSGYQAFKDETYLHSARLGINYLKSLQEFSPIFPDLYGVFHEDTPQTPLAFPRDALTAAWALMDYSEVTNDDESFKSAKLYADWFVSKAMEDGFPCWQVRFDGQPWVPNWFGSFHSGSAFFMGRMFQKTGLKKYSLAMHTILEHYNKYHLKEDGVINVIVDRKTMEVLDGKADLEYSDRVWEVMHRYNDDFGALANLLGWQIFGEEEYLNAAERFLTYMVDCQRGDGGFGPEEYSVPSAGGSVLIELLSAIKIGRDWIKPSTIEAGVKHLIDLQVKESSSPAYGAIQEIVPSGQITNLMFMRTHAYAVLAFLRAAGHVDKCYFIHD